MPTVSSRALVPQLNLPDTLLSYFVLAVSASPILFRVLPTVTLYSVVPASVTSARLMVKLHVAGLLQSKKYAPLLTYL